jgi:uncharacterized protein (TIGR00106 family)
MSVLIEITMFPTDKGESLSEYVARIISAIDESGLDYQLTPMGTIIETKDLREALDVVSKAYGKLETDCNRVYASIKIDIRKSAPGRMRQKVESVERQMGRKPRI